MKTTNYKSLELFIAFVLVPVSFALDYALILKLIVGFVGFVYILFVLIRIERIGLKISRQLNWKQFWRDTIIKLAIIAVLTHIYMWFYDSTNLYVVVINKPLLWIAIVFVYSFFSVYPQELIYRTFFFKRYDSLFQNKTLFLFINAALFSLGHIFFKNTMVMILTFIGGLLFALTFNKTKSTVLVSIEHAIYGCWLFTVGMGEMLGFPT
ncbi:CAAX prenyl protease-like protein [Winogradskyella wandonensis]|uniref:CAAX prenyl protease-like protein n=1 Tax=Winogradskyella wandonensis TaxID=1442586 RepID=A0A4R1KV23_9FLAO|nr:CPBP family intramembrane glutamic endopeptidase [Winogradskyella wandonensis]TCK68984.1 CAAX prenyl protease-like protein [Winogradskyella wandonensis]